MKPEITIQYLISQLSESSIEDYTSILQKFDFDLIDMSPYKCWSQKRYTRNCIYKDKNFEVLLLCWEAGQQTAIHGHDGEDCWVYLLEGEMKEVFYILDSENCLREERSHHIRPKQLTFMNDKLGFHKLAASNHCKSMSLHIYAKPIESCLYFDHHQNCFIERQLHFDNHHQAIHNNLI